MKLCIALTLATALGGLCVAIAQGTDDPFGDEPAKEVAKPFKHKLAADFGECPDGHRALVDIPIVYGLVGPLTKKPEDYNDQDRELSEKRDKGEIVFGGDILHEHSPKTQVVCKQCGFRFIPSDMPIEFPEMAFWSRNSKDLKSFRHPFGKVLTGFPRLAGWEESVSYSQSFKPDGKVLDSESISYQTNRPVKDVLLSVHQWLKDNGRDSAGLKRLEDAYAHHTYEYRAKGLSIHVIDDAFWKLGWVSITFLQQHEER